MKPNTDVLLFIVRIAVEKDYDIEIRRMND